MPVDDPFAAIPQLHDRRRFERALRPLKQTVPVRGGRPVLDEERTARRAAETGLWLPVTHPPRRRWLTVDMVIDDSRLATVHRPLADLLVDVVTSVGAFGQVRVHLLDTDVGGDADLRLRTPGSSTPPRHAVALAASGMADSQLVLVVTDGVGDAWRRGAAQELLARWAQSVPVAILHTLARRKWRRTGISTHGTWMRAPGAGPRGHWNGLRFPRVNEPEARPPIAGGVPVLPLDPVQLEGWSRLIAVPGQAWYGSLLVTGATEGGDEEELSSEGEPLDAVELVRRFRAAASPAAFRLMVHMAAVPLSLPVMRLVQRTMVPESRPADLAEIIGSGLLLRVNPQGVPHREEQPAEQVTYDFVADVRSRLLAAGHRSETIRTFTTVAEHLGPKAGILDRLREVLLAPEQAVIPPVTTDLVPLVEPALHTLRALAGPYLGPAHALESALARATTVRNDSPTARDVSTDQVEPRPPALPAEPPLETTQPATRSGSPTDASLPGVDMTSIRSMPAAAPRSPSEPPQIWGNVPQQNSNFVGREDLLDALYDRLSQSTTAAVLPAALHGMGGVGKSQIAVEYVYRHLSDYDLIWWIPAERPGQIQQALVELADQLGLNAGHEVNVAIPAVREALRLGRPHPNWLLIFDNAENVEEVREFFPTSGNGKILVTSRNKAWTGVTKSLEVDIFTREESIDLLRKRGPVLTDEDANQLAEILGDLPLAIEQAAVWLAETGMQVDEYLTLFRENHVKATELLQDLAPIPYELPVAAAWNVSLDRLRDTQPAALQLLQVCAFFAPEPISRELLVGSRDIDGPPELLEALNDPIKLGRALRSINQFGLAKINHQHNTITLHRLVQRVLVGQITDQQYAAELKHCGHQLLTKADPKQPENSRNWNKYADLLPHVLFADLLECDDPWARQLVLNEIDFTFEWGDHQGFLNLSKKAVEVWREKLGPEHQHTLSAGLRYGRALRILGHFQQAYEEHVQVRDILLEQEGAEDERTLEAQGYVAADLRYLGRFHDALELDRTSLEVLRRRFGPDEPLTLAQAHLYAITLRLTGEPAAALELDRDTHERKVVVLGENNFSTWSTLSAVAIDEMELGHYLEARNRMRYMVKRMRAKLGNNHPGAIENINILSVMERKAGEHALALELSTEAVDLFRRRYGDSHPSTLAASLNHALNLRQTGSLQESIDIARLSGQRYEELFGPKHPNTPSAHVNMSVTLRQQGDAAQAYELDQAATKTLTEVLGEDHPRTLICAINLASDLAALGDTQGSLNLNRRTLEQTLRRLGDHHPTALACELNYSIDLRAEGQESEAEKRFANVLARYQKTLGGDHPATVAATRNLRADCDIYPIPV